jgi:hypothetical protein
MQYSKTAPLFDHLVGTAEERYRDGEAQRPGGLEVDDQLSARAQSHRSRRLAKFWSGRETDGSSSDLSSV